MSTGKGFLLSNILSYPTLFGSVFVVILSTLLLIINRQKLHRSTRKILYLVFVVAILIFLFLVIMALAFGSNHPLGVPSLIT